ncbi:MAG: aa3-type cytochrome c oxidase subunit IV [Bauldia sp.]|nr:aa3-type cytochrome c oxidase subunit IV [Bauldia sp.]
MAHETLVLSATAADVAADMDYHRTSWQRFTTLMKWTSVGAAVVLVLLFVIFN